LLIRYSLDLKDYLVEPIPLWHYLELPQFTTTLVIALVDCETYTDSCDLENFFHLLLLIKKKKKKKFIQFPFILTLGKGSMKRNFIESKLV